MAYQQLLLALATLKQVFTFSGSATFWAARNWRTPFNRRKSRQ
jgi:hypothetical protein